MQKFAAAYAALIIISLAALFGAYKGFTYEAPPKDVVTHVEIGDPAFEKQAKEYIVQLATGQGVIVTKATINNAEMQTRTITQAPFTGGEDRGTFGWEAGSGTPPRPGSSNIFNPEPRPGCRDRQMVRSSKHPRQGVATPWLMNAKNGCHN